MQGIEAVVPSKIADMDNGVVTTTGNLGKIPQVATEGADDSGTWAMKSVAELLATVTFSAKNANALASAQLYTVAHGFNPSIPSWFGAVLVCNSPESDFALNDEISLDGLISGSNYTPGATVRVDATNIYVQCGTTNFQVVSSTGLVTLTPSKWNVKVYARL
jgi:hypothetical protein